MHFDRDVPERNFSSHAPGYWKDQPDTDWTSWQWQLQNRVTGLAALERYLHLTQEERSGVLLSGNKLAMAITPHFLNLIDRDDPDCPIRRQVIPRIEETIEADYEMADPCGEDGDMPVPGLVHRYPDRVNFLITDRCASYCRYCTRSRVVSGAGTQHLDTQFEAAFRYLEEHREIRDVLLSGGDPLLFPMPNWNGSSGGCVPSSTSNSSGSARGSPSSCRSGSHQNFARCSGSSIRSS